MFYPEKITLIKDTDRVLEVGPGVTPFSRSDIFLEKRFATEEEAFRQRAELNGTLDRETVYFDGKSFPFIDKEFDYVICSHVLEHVEDVSSFISELTRVAPRGYIEFPIATYDFLYNYDVHLNFMNFVDGKIVWCSKTKTSIGKFRPFNLFFRKTFELGHTNLVDELTSCFIVGFEWEGVVPFQEVETVEELGLEKLDPGVKRQESKLERHYVSEINRLSGQVNDLLKALELAKRPFLIKLLSRITEELKKWIFKNT